MISCPMLLGSNITHPTYCRDDCAWLVSVKTDEGVQKHCAITCLAVKGLSETNIRINGKLVME